MTQYILRFCPNVRNFGHCFPIVEQANESQIYLESIDKNAE